MSQLLDYYDKKECVPGLLKCKENHLLHFSYLPWQQFYQAGLVLCSSDMLQYQMESQQNQQKAEALYKQVSTSRFFSEDTALVYERILSLNPKHILALWDVGRIYDGDRDYEGNGSYWFELKCANKEKAFDCFTRIIEIDPKFSQAYLRLGHIYLPTNKEKALQYFLQYLSLKPQDYNAVGQTGEIYHLLGRKQEAIAMFTKCLQHNQRDQRALHGFASIREGQGDFNSALQYLKKCNGKNAETHARYGRVYHKMGNKKGAIHSYRKCRQLQYNHKQAQAYLDKYQKAYINEQLGNNLNH